MAKRKRLTPANPAFLEGAAEGKPALPPRITPAPIADVVRDASASAAAHEMARTLTEARTGGRMVIAVPLDAVKLDYLVRDRIAVQDEDMQTLKDSLKGRGQQTPVELVDLGGGRYGLISGWRRIAALRALFEETADPRFAEVLGLLRQPGDAAEAYQAMVEENEIRVGLSYFERARIVVKAVERGVFDTDRGALQTLFASASRARRSKIGSFVSVVTALDGALRFPEAISERLGLQLARALNEDDALGARLSRQVQQTPAPDAEAELAILEAALRSPAPTPAPAPAPEPPAAKQALTVPLDTDQTPASPRPSMLQRSPRRVTRSITLHYSGPGELTLAGDDVDDALRDDLIDWLRERGL